MKLISFEVGERPQVTGLHLSRMMWLTCSQTLDKAGIVGETTKDPGLAIVSAERSRVVYDKALINTLLPVNDRRVSFVGI